MYQIKLLNKHKINAYFFGTLELRKKSQYLFFVQTKTKNIGFQNEFLPL